MGSSIAITDINDNARNETPFTDPYSQLTLYVHVPFLCPICFAAAVAQLQQSEALHHVPHQHRLLHQQLLRMGISAEEHLRVCGV